MLQEQEPSLRKRLPHSAQLLPEGLTIAEIADRLRSHRPDPGWRTRAACAGLDAEMFYDADDKIDAIARDRAEEGRSVCAACVARWDCLRDALRCGERYGVWGGLDAFERERIRRRHRDVFNDIVGSGSRVFVSSRAGTAPLRAVERAS